MSNFYDKVYENFIKNVSNQHSDNYDEDRFGPKSEKNKFGLKEKIKNVLLKDRISSVDLKYYLPKFLSEFNKYAAELEFFYNSLGDQASKELLVDLICFKFLGNTKVKLKTNNKEYHKILNQIKKIADKNDVLDPGFLHFTLNKFNLKPMGKDIKIYFSPVGVLIEFFLEEYKYKNNDFEIKAINNDTVIDAGGCWADTALYFADKVGGKGKVYSFEFIPKNLAIFSTNINLNPKLQKHIKVIEKPVSDVSGKKVYYKDFGPASKVQFQNFKEADGETETISIDDFVKENNIAKIDFIKMDIEGSELPALEGAINVIKKDKPKLAIAIYHSWEDFINIPKWILGLNLGYKIYLGHYTIHSEETVIFATADD